MRKYLSLFTLLVLLLSSLTVVQAQDRLRLATTTSTDNSGLLAILHPPFEAKYNVKVDVIAVGTGKALQLGENGDVDVVLVHAADAELKFVASGFGIDRLPVMHNDFVVLGPAVDPAGVRNATSIGQAMTRISRSSAGFVSRGDESGTHIMELSLWQSANTEPKGDWYLAAGQGMGAVLTIANDKLAYALSDRGTFIAYKDKLELQIVLEGAPELFNPYHVILVNPERHPHTKADLGRKYIDFIRGEEGQKLIREFKISGEQLFYPDVIK